MSSAFSAFSALSSSVLAGYPPALVWLVIVIFVLGLVFLGQLVAECVLLFVRWIKHFKEVV